MRKKLPRPAVIISYDRHGDLVEIIVSESVERGLRYAAEHRQLAASPARTVRR